MIHILGLIGIHYAVQLFLYTSKKLKIWQTPNQYYFGYGANIDDSRFEKYHMCYQAIGPAVLRGYKLEFSQPSFYEKEGYASISSEKDHEVWGMLYKISYPSLIMLDILEWTPLNTYIRKHISVKSDQNMFKQVWVYIAKYSEKNRLPSDRYYNCIINGAKAAHFPQTYINFLESHQYIKEEDLEIDHGFVLSNPSKRRRFLPQLLWLYRIHDHWREYLMEKWLFG